MDEWVHVCLQDAARAAGGDPEQLDPRTDLKLASLDLAMMANERAALLTARAALLPHGCPGVAILPACLSVCLTGSFLPVVGRCTNL